MVCSICCRSVIKLSDFPFKLGNLRGGAAGIDELRSVHPGAGQRDEGGCSQPDWDLW
jgi:hypothetical protein